MCDSKQASHPGSMAGVFFAHGRAYYTRPMLWVKAFDIVFVDPPFNCQLVGAVCTALEARKLTHAETLIYIETAASEPIDHVPAHWSPHREKRAGGVAYRLFVAS